jgi:hypothetical protein
MKRRSFFGAMFGAPATTTLRAAGADAPTTITVHDQGMRCSSCGSEMYCHGQSGAAYKFFTCTLLDCPHYNIPVEAAVVQVKRADPEQVEIIRASEVRAWNAAKVQDEIVRLRRLHLWAANSADGKKSWRIRKGHVIVDYNEPSGHRLLTDEEIARITAPPGIGEEWMCWTRPGA